MSQITATTDTHTLPPDSHQGWQQEQLFSSAEAFYSALLASIASAQHTIELETYIFDYDQVGKQVVKSLIAAHHRGVKIRVLMDAVGSYQSSSEAAQRLEQAGISVKLFHPLPWQINHYHRAATRQGKLIDQFLYFLSRINQRDHRKLCIIDKEQLWTGSLNITQKHLLRENGGEGWRDYGVNTSGPLVAELEAHFDALWNRRKIIRKEGLFQHYWHNYDLWSRRRKNQLLLRQIRDAKSRIWIVSAYFAPASSIIRALKEARQRHIDIKILVPSHSDIGLFPFLTATYYSDLIQSGMDIYEYQPGVLHAKALFIDDHCMIGSTNFNHRSFLHDLELDISLTRLKSKRTLESFFKSDLADSIRITPDKPKYGIYGKFIGTLARVLRYWM
jgi:cardiolipin synthase